MCQKVRGAPRYLYLFFELWKKLTNFWPFFRSNILEHESCGLPCGVIVQAKIRLNISIIRLFYISLYYEKELLSQNNTENIPFMVAPVVKISSGFSSSVRIAIFFLVAIFYFGCAASIFQFFDVLCAFWNSFFSFVSTPIWSSWFVPSRNDLICVCIERIVRVF